MNHSPPLWQSPPHSTHLTLPNRRRWLCYHHNVDKQWQLSQTEGHFDGSGSNESWLWKKWHISVCSEAYSQDIKRLRPWWDASAPDENSSPGLDGMKLVNWSLGPVTSLSWQKETRSNISVSEGRCSHRVLSPPRVYRPHTLAYLSCSTVDVSVMGLIVGAACQILPSPSNTTTTTSGLFPLSSPFLGIFIKGCRRKAELTQKESKAVFLGIIGIVWWSTKSRKRRGGQRSRSYFKGSGAGELYLPQFLARREKAWSLSLELITVAAQTKQGRAWKCYIKN